MICFKQISVTITSFFRKSGTQFRPFLSITMQWYKRKLNLFAFKKFFKENKLETSEKLLTVSLPVRVERKRGVCDHLGPTNPRDLNADQSVLRTKEVQSGSKVFALVSPPNRWSAPRRRTKRFAPETGGWSTLAYKNFSRGCLAVCWFFFPFKFDSYYIFAGGKTDIQLFIG